MDPSRKTAWNLAPCIYQTSRILFPNTPRQRTSSFRGNFFRNASSPLRFLPRCPTFLAHPIVFSVKMKCSDFCLQANQVGDHCLGCMWFTLFGSLYPITLATKTVSEIVEAPQRVPFCRCGGCGHLGLGKVRCCQLHEVAFIQDCQTVPIGMYLELSDDFFHAFMSNLVINT